VEGRAGGGSESEGELGVRALCIHAVTCTHREGGEKQRKRVRIRDAERE